jgi:hypothetical protein
LVVIDASCDSGDKLVMEKAPTFKSLNLSGGVVAVISKTDFDFIF